MISALSILILLPLGLLSALFLLVRPTPRSSKAPPASASVSRIPLVGSLDFFTRRWDFWKEARARSKTGNFSFTLAQYNVIGLSGTAGREHFFGSNHYSFDAGYAVLFGQAPNASMLEAAKVPEGEAQTPSHFTKRIVTLMKREKLQSSLNQMMSDTRTQLDALGKTGITNPFDSIYLLVFQLTVRIVGCREIAEDPVLLKRVLGLFGDVEKSSTPATILFPWFPSAAKVKRTLSAGQLYIIFQGIVDARKKEGRAEDDPLQTLIDEGDSLRQILEFVIGALFAGQLNSGINACYLALDSEWTSKCRAEISSVASKYASDPTLPLEEQLLEIPIEAWETEFPVLDLCLKDTIRLHLQGAALRRNISGRADKLGDEIVDNGAMLAYHLADVHMDPEVYADPDKWDPSRYLPDRAEDKKVPFGWLGWGVARHPCLGMRFAKIEQNVILAFFLTKFDYNLCDAKGTKVDALPPLDANAHSACKPSTPVYLSYTQRKQ
ncbi:hypothetical protein P7C70_g1842, partial [Phenoliferia sp. Uapishka_3]